MRYIITLPVIAITLLLHSCSSSMKVHVDALNMPAFRATYLYNSEDLNKKENAIMNTQSKSFLDKIDAMLNSVYKSIDDSGHVATQNNSYYKDLIAKSAEEVLEKLKATGTKALSSLDALKQGNDASLKATFEKDYLDFKNSFGELQNLVTNINTIEESIKPDLSLETQYRIDEVNNTIMQLSSAFGESILNDPLSSVIAALPDKYWSKYKQDVNLSLSNGEINSNTIGDVKKYSGNKPTRFNTTHARTFIGNSDIAIKMTTPGEFIVKGVRVDADEAVRNSFKVVSQGIKYLAYASGIPVVEGPNSPKKSIVPLLDSLNQKELSFNSTKSRYAKATDVFLQVVTDAAPDLKATEGKNGLTAAQVKDAALERIKTAYTIYRNTLSN